MHLDDNRVRRKCSERVHRRRASEARANRSLLEPNLAQIEPRASDLESLLDEGPWTRLV